MKIIVELFTTETERVGEALEAVGRKMSIGATPTLEGLSATGHRMGLIDGMGVKIGEVTVTPI